MTNVDLSEFCITSKANIYDDNNIDIVVDSKKALGEKCSVCWKIRTGQCSRNFCGLILKMFKFFKKEITILIFLQ